MDHKLCMCCQDNLCDTQPLLAAFFPQGCRNCSGSSHPGYHLSQGCPNPLLTPCAACWCSTHCHSLILNYHALRKTGFCTHILMCTKADTSGKFPACSGCAAEYAECEHRADLASAWLHLDNLPGLSSCKVWGTLSQIIVMFCRLRFYQ